MIQINLLLIISLVITGSYCEDVCTEETKMSFSIMFCDEATHCSNETAEEFLDNFRKCIEKSSDEAKQLIESGNKLHPEECIIEVSKKACSIVNDIKEHTEKYAECMALFTDMESVLKSCAETGDSAAEGLERMAKVICADPSKVKCDSNEKMEAIEIVKNCLTENVASVKNVKNSGDLQQCKTEAKEVLIKAIQENKINDFMNCIEPKKDFLDKNNPGQCSGFE